MSRKITTESFIEKANIVHNNLYDYSLVEYENSKTKVKIICKKHGIFEQLPHSHFNKRGCPFCAKTDINTFIKKANTVHNFKYDYSLVDYQGVNRKVKIICKIHGVFEQQVNSHLQGANCPKCNHTCKESFIKKSNQIHNNKFDYSKSNYTKREDKITIICPLHGEFIQSAHNHLKGQNCPTCAGKAKVTEESFLLNANKVHNNLYTYSNFIFTKNREKSYITCQTHGDFLQDPDHHVNQKQGCPECSKELTYGWSKSQFKKQCEVNNNAKGILYIIKCFNNFEEFYKIGITSRSIKRRYSHTGAMPYSYNIIQEEIGDSDFIYELEIQLKQKLKEFHYLPKIPFKGSVTECFTKIK